jgi:hypothetical protein
MDAKKRKKLEEQLRQLFAQADQSTDPKRPITESKPSVIRVIRRRKGVPDMQIA